jgi:signal transduction histidine kinase
VLINLLVNARDAIDDAYNQKVGGKIKILSRCLKEEAVVMVGVMDNGKPVAEGTQGMLFTSFFTTKDPSKGTGLGLAVCKDIIKKHNGLINFATLKDCRKAFYFVLPVEGEGELGKNQDLIHQKASEIFETF